MKIPAAQGLQGLEKGLAIDMIFTADKTNVKVMGRTLVKDGIRYLNYSCSSIEFIFTGKKAEAVLWTNSPTLEPIYKAWVAVYVNDEETPLKRFALDKEEDTYVLYEGEQSLETKIKLVKYSEVAFGKVGIKSITIDSEEAPRPAAENSKKLEFIGDSITFGYGNEGVLNVDVFSTSQENPWDAYAAITARALNADYHLISWSGIGIISNWTDQEVPNDDWLMPDLYPYTDKSMDIVLNHKEYEVWDNSKFVPDCIIINLGTNDSSYTKNVEERVATFGEQYFQFIKQIRDKNPSSKILCTLGVMGQDLCGAIEQQVERLNKEGDSQVYFMAFDQQNQEDGIGTDWHPSKVTHRKMATKLEAKIREIMEW
jgi:lysophospholipase L1-like esterase